MKQKIRFVLEDNSDIALTHFAIAHTFPSALYLGLRRARALRRCCPHTSALLLWLLADRSGLAFSCTGCPNPMVLFEWGERTTVSFYTFSTSDLEQELKCWDLLLGICGALKSVMGHLFPRRRLTRPPQHPREPAQTWGKSPGKFF